MQKKILSILFASSLSLLLSACATNPPDSEVCTEIHQSKGWCTFTISDREFYIDDERPYDFKDGKGPQTWWALRPTMVQVPAPTWAKIKAYIIKTCKKYGNCDSAISGWERRADKMDEQLKQKGL